MCWTSTVDYERADVPKLNADTIAQVQDNFDASYGYEQEKQPDLSYLRFQYPKEVRSDLALGGNLRPDTQDQVYRGALNQAGQSGILNSFQGRGLVAKDIAQTSEALRTQRMGQTQNYLKGEPLEFMGLTSGQIASVFTDDKTREFQSKREKAQAQTADTAQNLQIVTSLLGLL